MLAFTADFETTTDPDDCRVWAFACCSIDAPDFFVYGISIEEFMQWCEDTGNCKLYFHNLAFDGSFIMDWAERNGWKWVESQDNAGCRTYETLISDMNQVYCITLQFYPGCRVKIYDSLKIIPLSIAAMSKAFGLPMAKGSIDYTAYREPGHELTEEEIEYIKGDVQIAAWAMKVFLDQGLTKMTAGSNALADYKSMVGKEKGFRKVYPILTPDQDEFIRKAYRGGYTYVNPRYQGKVIDGGIVLDVNSLYPSVMKSASGELLPHGKPEWFDGEPSADDRMPLWVAMVTCSFKIKDRHLPCIQLKGNFRFKQTEYLESSDGIVTFTVTNIDWALICDQYEVDVEEWHGGYKFKCNDYMFKPYIEKWGKVKEQATIDGNKGMRFIAKRMLNSLYGKFAMRIEVRSRKPVLENGVLRYRDLEPEAREPVYLPVGVFITSWARNKTIRSAQANYDRFIYADTDSMHMVGTELPDNVDIDPVRLGAWDHESTFDKAKFLAQKCYVEHEVGADELTVHVAGMPTTCHSQVTVENFNFGTRYSGKLYQKRVPGGIVFEEGDMEVRER